MYIFHNANYDLHVLQWDLEPDQFEDTMVMAYVLANLPKKLKALSYRLLGRALQDYQDVLSPYQEEETVKFLHRITESYEPEYQERISSKTGKQLKPQLLPKSATIKVAERCLRAQKPTDHWRQQDESIHQAVAQLGLGQLPELTLRDVPESILVEYACADADVTRQIYPLLKAQIEGLGLQHVYTLDKACLPIYRRMEETGILCDPDHFIRLSAELDWIMDLLLQELLECSEVPRDFNPSSSQQTAELLFSILGLGHGKRLKRTSSGQISTEEPYLQAIKHYHPVVPRILQYREAKKLKTSYTDKIPNLLSSDHRYHPDINFIGTVSGRIAEALLVLIPKHSSWDMGKRIRQGFIAGPGNVLASWDLSQIELRVLAHSSQDPVLCDIFRRGEDLHAATAHRVLGAPARREDQDRSRHRLPAKTLNFAIPMGISASGLLREIQAALSEAGASPSDIESWDEGTCQDMLKAWYKESYPTAGRYLREKALECEETGTVRSFDGRLRYLPAIWSPHDLLREEAKRQAQSFPMQAGAQHVKKQWMVNVWAAIWKQRLANPLCEIHDDLLSEMEEQQYDCVDVGMNACLPQCLSIPVCCEGSKGVHWGEL